MIYKPRIKKSNYLLVTTSIITVLITYLSVFGSCNRSNIPIVTQYTLTIYSDISMPVDENILISDDILRKGSEVNIRASTEIGWDSVTWTVDMSTMSINESTFLGMGKYKEGSAINISASAATGWDFIEWTGDIETINNRFSSNTDIVMNGNYEITAHFNYPIITHSISNVVFSPETPARLSFGEKVKVSFDYQTNDKIAAYIFMHPFTNGSITSEYLFSGGRIYHPWQRKGEVNFTIKPQVQPVVIDQIRFRIMNIYQTEILNEIFVPVSYTFQ